MYTIEEVTLRGTQTPEEWARALASAHDASGPVRLRLDDPTPALAEHLCGEVLPALHAVRVERFGALAEETMAIMTRWTLWSALEVLEWFAPVDASVSWMVHLAAILAQTGRLRALCFESSSPWRSAGARAFARCALPESLESLEFGEGVGLSNGGAAAIFDATRTGALVFGEKLGKAFFNALAKHHRQHPLHTLALPNAPLTDEALGVLLTHPALRAATTLRLSGCIPGAQGRAALRAAPLCDTIEALEFKQLHLDEQLAAGLLSCPNLREVAVLVLFDEHLGVDLSGDTLAELARRGFPTARVEGDDPIARRLEALQTASEATGTGALHDLFGEVRALLHEPPSVERFITLLQHVHDAHTASPEQCAEHLIPYLEQQLELWPDETRSVFTRHTTHEEIARALLQHITTDPTHPIPALVRVVQTHADVWLHHPALVTLRSLTVRQRALHPDLVDRLHTLTPPLHTLYLERTSGLNQQASALCAAPWMRTLHHLRLEHNRAGKRALAALWKHASPDQGLTSLRLASEPNGASLIPLIAGDPRAETLRTLALNRCRVDAELLETLAASPHLGGLERLELRDNTFPEGARACLHSARVQTGALTICW